MNHIEYDEYVKGFNTFMDREGIENLSSDPHDDYCPRYGKNARRHPRTGRFMKRASECHCEPEPSFSSSGCEVCGAVGDVERASGYNREHAEVRVYDSPGVCSDCLYFAEYGKLDDMTMMEVEKSREEQERMNNLPLGEHSPDDCPDDNCARVECYRNHFAAGLAGPAARDITFGDLDGRPVYGPFLPPLDSWAWPGGYTLIYYAKGENSNCDWMGEEVFARTVRQSTGTWGIRSSGDPTTKALS